MIIEVLVGSNIGDTLVNGLDLRLDETAEIPRLSNSGQPPCDYVRGVAEARLADVERRIAEIQRARDELRDLLARVDRLPSSDACFCDLIESTTIKTAEAGPRVRR